MASVPGDHNEIQLIGTALAVHAHHKAIAGILLKANASDADPLLIVVVPPQPMHASAIERGARLWVRGSLACDRDDTSKESMHFIQARHLELVRRHRQPASDTTADGRRASWF
jgi:hypothetical protein